MLVTEGMTEEHSPVVQAPQVAVFATKDVPTAQAVTVPPELVKP